MSPFDPNILDYTAMGGTSMSCPITAGVAALILSIEPDLTGDEVCHFLERSAKDLGDPGRDDYYGWGRVDARAALDMVLARRADLNGNWRVDEADEAILLAAIDTNDVSADIAPAAKRDGTVDGNDLALLTQYMGTEIPDLGLIAHWTFDETEGVVAYDMVGQRTATTVGAPLWQPEGGAIGGALELSGGGNFLMTKSVRDPSEGPLSVFVWVKGGAPGQAIVSQQGGAGWLLADPAAGGLMTELKASRRNASDLVSEAMITDGDWHRVGFTWDGEIRVLYVDDAEVTTDTQPSLAGSTGNLLFGAAARPGPGTYWTGLIDDVRIYNRAVRP